MGNHHSHSSDDRQSHHRQSHHTNSNKYNIISAGNGHQPTLTLVPNNNIKTKTNDSHNNGKASSAPSQAPETLTKDDRVCICSSLNYTSVDECDGSADQKNEANDGPQSPAYELVKIGTGTSIKRNSSRRVSYSWRKVQPDSQNLNSQGKQQQTHHRGCPLHVAIKPVDAQPSSSNLVVSMNSLEKLCRLLVATSNAGGQISKAAFQQCVLPHCQVLSEYVWNYFQAYSSPGGKDYGMCPPTTISEQKFFRAADKIYSYITDKDQIQFWFKVFGRGRDCVDRNDFKMFLLCAYQLSTTKANSLTKDVDTIDKLDGKEWMEAVTKSCFHIKDEMSIVFLCNWIANNLPRILIPLHKYVVHRLTTTASGQQNMKPVPKEQLPDEAKSPRLGTNSDEGTEHLRAPSTSYSLFNEDKFGSVSTMNSILLWLLSCSLPYPYISPLIKKPEIRKNQLCTMSPQQFILQLINNASDPECWTLLYNSDEHGTSVNRFQFHVFHYRGPTLMVINADNGYKICVACDIEWKESCHFWGGEDSSIYQLEPEFRLVEKGKNIMYVNFSIRGYPFGIQVGKDPKNVVVEINPDFQYISFKKIPCKIESILVYGCALSQAVISQNEYKKWEAKECEKQKKVNLNAGAWTDNPDKYLLELAGTYQDYGHHGK